MAEAKAKKADKKAAPVKAKKVGGRRPRAPKFLKKIGGYFKGAWAELRYTKWPTRRSTWSLTLAVIVFTAVIMLFIIGVDYVFNTLFERLIL